MLTTAIKDLGFRPMNGQMKHFKDRTLTLQICYDHFHPNRLSGKSKSLKVKFLCKESLVATSTVM